MKSFDATSRTLLATLFLSGAAIAAEMPATSTTLDTNLIAVGAIDEAAPLIRSIIELCVLKRATAVLLTHNHPNGCVDASCADIDFTSLLERELNIIGVNLVEHIIVDGVSYNPILKGIRRINDIYDQIDLNEFYL
jgi:DNA repair protein RadC